MSGKRDANFTYAAPELIRLEDTGLNGQAADCAPLGSGATNASGGCSSGTGAGNSGAGCKTGAGA